MRQGRFGVGGLEYENLCFITFCSNSIYRVHTARTLGTEENANILVPSRVVSMINLFIP